MKELRRIVLTHLVGVGDRNFEWVEESAAYHLRRRLTEDEIAVVGPVVDVRGTAEGVRRLEELRWELPPAGIVLAMEELGISS